MTDFPTNPRVLIVTPEVTYLPKSMGSNSNNLNAKAGGLADVSAALISELYRQEADVHVALPDYRSIFNGHLSSHVRRELNTIRKSVPSERIHLAQDRAFFYLNHIYSGYEFENIKISLAFQREVINNIVPQIQPDLKSHLSQADGYLFKSHTAVSELRQKVSALLKHKYAVQKDAESPSP